MNTVATQEVTPVNQRIRTITIFLMFHSFCASGIQEGLGWMVLSQGSHADGVWSWNSRGLDRWEDSWLPLIIQSQGFVI